MKAKLLIACLSICFGLFGQEEQTSKQYLEKVQSLDSTIETLYAVISGEAGESRDWDLFQYLFLDQAKLIPSGKNREGKVGARFLTVEDYVTNIGPRLEENGFFEKEIHRVAQTYGTVGHVFSTYESYRSEQDEKPFTRGINSIQLMHDGERWWIVNIFWMGESEEFPIPAKYLPN